MKEKLKVILRVLIALVLYGGVTLLLTESSSGLIRQNALFPPIATDMGLWIAWVNKSIYWTAGSSLVLYFLYQILTSRLLLGKSSIKDLKQNRIGILNWLSVPIHFAIIWYLGFYVNGYGSGNILFWLMSIGLKRSYIFLLPALVFTVLYWLLSRFLSNSCVFRYKRWKWIR